MLSSRIQIGWGAVLALLLLLASSPVRAQGIPGMPNPDSANAAFLAFGEAADSSLTAAVHNALDAYRAALLADDGAAAWETIDARSRTYYADMLEHCLSGDSARIAALPVLDMMTALMMRARIPNDALLAFDARDLFVYAIDEGMVGKGGVMAMAAGAVRVDGEHAQSEALVDGKPTGLYMDFYREEAGWRFDLSSIFDVAGAAMAMQLEQQGQTPVDFTFEVLQLLTGKAPDPSIWHPIKPAER